MNILKKNIIITFVIFLINGGYVVAGEEKHWRDVEYYDKHHYYEAIIDHPVEKVWRHVLNIKGWLNRNDTETIAGEPLKVGHISKVYPKKLGDDVDKPHYNFYKLAEVIPNKLLTLKIYSEKGGSYGSPIEDISFETIFLSEIGGKTKVSLIYNQEKIRNGLTDKEIEKIQKNNKKYLANVVAKYWENLKQSIENGG